MENDESSDEKPEAVDSGKQIHEALTSVLHHHFPELEKVGAAKKADDLLRKLDIIRAWEKIERSDKRPEDDMVQLQGAANSLRIAAKKLSEIGWHGQKTIPDVLTTVFSDPLTEVGVWYGSGQIARDLLVQHIENIQDELLLAAKAVDLDGASVESAFSDDPEAMKVKRKTNSPKTTARFFAQDCAECFQEVSGRKLGQYKEKFSWKGDGASTAFEKFLSDAFEAVNLKASAEKFAKEVIKNYKG